MRSKAHWGYDEAFMQACRPELTVTDEDLANADSYYCIAQLYESLERKLIGFYKLQVQTQQRVELDALFVDPKYIGQGIGRVLFNHAEGFATALGASEMLVQSDPNAVEFYQTMGGVVFGETASGSISGRQLPVLKFALGSEGTLNR
ncbi:GNAT family N-acetyltransferase [Arenicella xantha]|nr:GNAT family N-acetyltransferase [Arenicella xantha]